MNSVSLSFEPEVIMRASALIASVAGILASTSLPASAATMVQDFSFDVTGPSQAAYIGILSLFNPQFGTLTSISETLSGSPTWTPGSSPATLSILLILLPTIDQAAFAGGPSGDAEVIDVNLMQQASDPMTLMLFSAVGTTQLEVGAEEDPLEMPNLGTLSGTLSGTLTYTFTSAVGGVPTVPEPSTWAMLLVGFAGLGYAALRRKGAAREVCV
jgi:PEP-CTERM motif